MLHVREAPDEKTNFDAWQEIVRSYKEHGTFNVLMRVYRWPHVSRLILLFFIVVGLCSVILAGTQPRYFAFWSPIIILIYAAVYFFHDRITRSEYREIHDDYGVLLADTRIPMPSSDSACLQETLLRSGSRMIRLPMSNHF